MGSSRSAVSLVSLRINVLQVFGASATLAANPLQRSRPDGLYGTDAWLRRLPARFPPAIGNFVIGR